MQAVDCGAVKVYDLGIGKTLPSWLSNKQKESLRKDFEFRKRIELIQDFGFKATSRRVKMSADSNYIIAAGEYPPQIKVYDTRELSMKFERHLDAEVVDFEILSTDYTKLVILGSDRTLDFHAAYGSHHRIRVPRFGRDLAYDPFGCELFISASEKEIYRVDLEQGKFLAPYKTQHENGVNCMYYSKVFDLLACGGSDGVVSLWDARARSCVGRLSLEGLNSDIQGSEITSIKLDEDIGLSMGVGTSTGEVSHYDIRSRKPVFVKEHHNDLPICSVNFQYPGRLMISADAKSIKVWNRDTGVSFCNIEPTSDISDMCVVPLATTQETSGLIFASGETESMMTYYIPRLGRAPGWASFLDNLTEELEETEAKSSDLYENYKFIQTKELEGMGLLNLVGTNLLRPYMHGHFIDMRLYRKLKSISEPVSFEDWRKSQIRERMEKDAEKDQRIVRNKNMANAPKVNKALSERLLAAAEKEGLEKDKVSADSRFAAVFEDEDFAIEDAEESPEEIRSTETSDNQDYVEPEVKKKSDVHMRNEHKSKNKSRKIKLSVPGKSDKGAAGFLQKKHEKSSGSKRNLKRTIKERIEAERRRDAATRQLPGGNLETTFVPKRGVH